MGGTVMVVIQCGIAALVVTVALGLLVDTTTGTDVVTSVQTGVTYQYGLCYAELARHKYF